MTTLKTFKIAMIATATAGLAMAPAAFASTADTVSVEIDTRYLETEWGVEIVYDKLVKKSESACSTDGTRGLQEIRIASDCASVLLDSFVENAASEILSEHHSKMRS
ncbi:UrcA family protein [Litorimonas sp. WD9-15]|uniref:UrcA family protein n=1 Tax=Litorimonas sp. WD9-15 TaxID=3418716 RepID=UPI003CFC9C7E